MAYDLAMKIFTLSQAFLDGYIGFEEYEDEEQVYWRVAGYRNVTEQVREILARFAKNDFSK